MRIMSIRRCGISLCAILAIAACARSPETIQATTVPTSTYDGQSCPQLLATRLRVREDLDAVTAYQKSTSQKDALGVFLIGLPTASMTGGDVAPRVASLKGQRDTLDQVIAQKQCL